MAGLSISLFLWSIITKIDYSNEVKNHQFPKSLGRAPTMSNFRTDTLLTRPMDAFLFSIRIVYSLEGH